ncbi:hypothetical protein HU200_052732 [Digitaria exilis]|uniref:Uncharacterized protein n=1 Tax=Digitaria exilis TaxID=1010633 RepID=A0A835ALH5_9POAL|nr:hypothetical protein HU200_052732 [Digitaria exilis]
MCPAGPHLNTRTTNTYTSAQALTRATMPLPSGHPLAVLLLVILLLAATSGPAPAAATLYTHGGGRMAIARAPGATTTTMTATGGGGRSRRSSMYDDDDERRRRRLVEDEVTPELATAAGLLGADVVDFNPYETLIAYRPVCLPSNCPAKSGQPYTRPCLLGC